ncbi:Nif11-like leader peptide family RiPP precursor [Synechococcus sp. BIOS-E4-1]|uniref:Nif11-like leader peptide family RiPP precursor n=1 Tax=Synechococcus sp. BIOS-E4-1 TaxID=1400864 RepID=UPI002107EE0A|nr:Nif11-like leader peptide family RiPP precursor [Synechococcus sp. BIOS-E4-1]
MQEQLKAEGADPVAIAKSAGFSITTEELEEHRQFPSDAEIETLAGGKVSDFCTSDIVSYCCW